METVLLQAFSNKPVNGRGSVLEAKLYTKIRAKSWQAFMKSLNLLFMMIVKQEISLKWYKAQIK